MKQNPITTPASGRDAREDALFEAILTLESVDDCRAFFGDLATPAELEALVDRWAVVPALAEGQPYRHIQSATGVSVTTIGRVARCLGNETGGYRRVLRRLGRNNP
ncbi:MAG: YerC/YecD family TrpR-related protein [Pseudomonadota bacterium]